VKERGAAVLGKIADGIPGVKVLLVADSAEDAKFCRQLGVAGVVVKPLTVENVRRKVDAALGRGPAFNPLKVLG
jgi:AmiR/NasT family two-component response regulator